MPACCPSSCPAGLIRALLQSPASKQRKLIERHYTPDCRMTHALGEGPIDLPSASARIAGAGLGSQLPCMRPHFVRLVLQ